MTSTSTVRGVTAASRVLYKAEVVTTIAPIETQQVLGCGIITDWNIGHNEYWGRVGHYKVAGTACTLLKDQTARDFFTQNLANIAFGDDEIRKHADGGEWGACTFPDAGYPGVECPTHRVTIATGGQPITALRLRFPAGANVDLKQVRIRELGM